MKQGKWVSLGPRGSCTPTPAHTHLLVVILGCQEIVHQGRSGAQLLAQRIQEAVRVPASHWAGEGEELPAAGWAGGIWARGAVRVAGPRARLWGGRPAAVQAGVGVGLGAAGGGQVPRAERVVAGRRQQPLAGPGDVGQGPGSWQGSGDVV